MVLLRVTDYRRRLMDAKRFQRGKAKKVRIRLTPPDEIAARKRSYRALERGYRRVTELDPKLAEAWCELASILDIRDRLDEAAKAARMAVRLDPAHDHIALLARIRAQQGFRSESQALARKVLRSKSAYARSAAADILRGEWDPRAFANPLEYRRMIRDITRAIRAKVRPIK
jgi:tetratricopeptide (TPR) repeat protein